jgi:hypothetical protein
MQVAVAPHSAEYRHWPPGWGLGWQNPSRQVWPVPQLASAPQGRWQAPAWQRPPPHWASVRHIAGGEPPVPPVPPVPAVPPAPPVPPVVDEPPTPPEPPVADEPPVAVEPPVADEPPVAGAPPVAVLPPVPPVADDPALPPRPPAALPPVPPLPPSVAPASGLAVGTQVRRSSQRKPEEQSVSRRHGPETRQTFVSRVQ